MLYYNVQYHDDNELENETKDLLLKICDKAVTKDIMMYKIIKSAFYLFRNYFFMTIMNMIKELVSLNIANKNEGTVAAFVSCTLRII